MAPKKLGSFYWKLHGGLLAMRVEYIARGDHSKLRTPEFRTSPLINSSRRHRCCLICAEINLSPPIPISAPFQHSKFRSFIEGTATLTLLWELVVVIHR